MSRRHSGNGNGGFGGNDVVAMLTEAARGNGPTAQVARRHMKNFQIDAPADRRHPQGTRGKVPNPNTEGRRRRMGLDTSADDNGDGSVATAAPPVKKKPGRPAGKQSADQRIEIPELKLQHLRIKIIGDMPLIVHNWSEKAKQEMRNKQFGLPQQKKAPKNPDQCVRDSIYWLPKHQAKADKTEYGFPAIAFKSAAVDACTHITGIPKTIARGAFHINQELVPIYGKMVAREDMVRIGGMTKVADLRYRAAFVDWHTEFVIEYNANVISPAQIANLFNTGGFAIGVGEWRAEKNGVFGKFHVARENDNSGNGNGNGRRRHQ